MAYLIDNNKHISLSSVLFYQKLNSHQMNTKKLRQRTTMFSEDVDFSPVGMCVISVGVALSQANHRDGVRMSTSRAFLHPVLDRDNLHVAVDSRVNKVSCYSQLLK